MNPNRVRRYFFFVQAMPQALNFPRLLARCVSAVGFFLLAHVGDVSAAKLSCKQELGEQRAAQLVKQCVTVSPATHPPCNAANSCQMIEDEIERGCNIVGSWNVLFCHVPVKAATFTGTLVNGGGVDATTITFRRDDGNRVHAICMTCGDWLKYSDDGDIVGLLPAYLGKRATVTVKEERNGGRIESAGKDDRLVFVKKIEFVK